MSDATEILARLKAAECRGGCNTHDFCACAAMLDAAEEMEDIITALAAVEAERDALKAALSGIRAYAADHLNSDSGARHWVEDRACLALGTPRRPSLAAQRRKE
jgi:hypothetical protein